MSFKIATWLLVPAVSFQQALAIITQEVLCFTLVKGNTQQGGNSYEFRGSLGFPTVKIRPRDPLVRDQGVLIHDMQWLIKCLKSKDFQNGVDTHQVGALSDSAWLRSITSFLLDPSQFTAGYISHTHDLFKLYFSSFGSITSAGKQILQWLQHGLRIEWVPYNSPSQQMHPRYSSKLQQVKQLISQTLGEYSVHALLAKSEPQPAVFPNRVSVVEHQDFVGKTISNMLAQGSIAEWTMPYPITVVNGMGVVVNRVGKKRLIVDARYINLFDRYQSFSYEKLMDVTRFVQPADFFILTDFKNGYHQLKMHPATYRFLGISVKNKVYYFTVLPFGLSSACRAYTMLMSEVYRPLRMHMQRMTFLIDDALFAFADKRAGKFQAFVIIKLLTCLGFFFAVEKSTLVPCQRGQFLGLTVDVAHMRFEIPGDKLVYIKGLLRDALHAAHTGAITSRDLAKVAGVLLSVKDAMHFAPLYTRLLFQAVAVETTVPRSWDNQIPEFNRAFAIEDLEFWVAHIDHMHGKFWVRRAKVYHVDGDVSETAYAGLCDLLRMPISQPFSAHESQLMRDGRFSSTLRETINARVCIETVLHFSGEDLRGSLLLYSGDNQGAIHCLRGMKGSGRILEEVKQVYILAAACDCQLDFHWLPRSQDRIVAADALSRIPDDSQIIIQDTAFQRICRFNIPPHVQTQFPSLGLTWGYPTWDLFAGCNPGEHRARRFFTPYACPGTQGVNALHYSWHRLHDMDERTLFWSFPPFYLIGDVLQKLRAEEVNTVLILPRTVKYWQPLLHALPVVASVPLSGIKNLFRIGSQAPRYMHMPGFRLHLMAYLVIFQ